MSRPDALGVPRRRGLRRPDGAHLAVVEVGEPTAPAWVVAHGVGSSARFVAAAFAGPLRAAGRRLVTYDLRGHGGSSPAPDGQQHHLDVHADDLAAVIATVDTDVEVAGGVSLGAHAAVRAAATGRLGAIVLACLPAWTGRSPVGTGPHAVIAEEVRRVGVAGLVARLRADDGLPGWLRDTLLTDYPRHDPASLAAALIALDGGDAPTAAQLRGLPVPLALVAWDGDPGHPLVVARDWQRWAPRTALIEVDLGSLDHGLDVLGEAARRAVGQLPG